jgi:uncharacterized protein
MNSFDSKPESEEEFDRMGCGAGQMIRNKACGPQLGCGLRGGSVFRWSVVLLFSLCVGACSAPAVKRESTNTAAVSATTPVPTLKGRVNDTADVLSTEDRERITNLLAGYEKETKHQYAVLIVPTLGGESIESFCLQTLNTWRLGRRGINDGILVCMAMRERQVRVELGYGMERFISNAEAKEIIDTDMTPWFAKGDYAGGLQRGLVRLMDEGRRFVARD